MTELTKWPRLIVVGDPVTREQANDILIRTNDRYFFTNDHAWEQIVADVYGIPLGKYGLDHQASAAVFERLGVLNLRYLTNARIMSSWIGGPHGWCDWDGRIGCNTHNIGKWPAVEEVQEDLDAIAGTWPFLRMQVQLVTDEGEGELAAMWVVRDGTPTFVEPGERLPMADLSEGQLLDRLLSGRLSERGVALDRLREAVAQVAGS